MAVYTSKNPDFRLPPSPETPIIMVGPGTGLAPFRAFVQHRLLSASEARAPPGEAVLFFGCRRRDQDFLYRDLLEGWHETGAIQLRTAFSRETSNKVLAASPCTYRQYCSTINWQYKSRTDIDSSTVLTRLCGIFPATTLGTSVRNVARTDGELRWVKSTQIPACISLLQYSR